MREVENEMKSSVEVSAEMKCAMQEAAEMIFAMEVATHEIYTEFESFMINESSNQNKNLWGM